MKLTKRLVTSMAPALALAVALGFASGDRDLLAQNRKDFSVVDEHTGHVALGLAIRKLNVSGTFIQAPAHPDDETNALFAMFTYGRGLRAIDLQNNRGEGGQNEIGPELFRDMGVLRTAELMSAHRIDGAEQYFTRAIDYGYSFDPQEVIQKWGRDTIVGDYVRLIRTLRPDVIVTMNIQGGGGDRAHEATTVLTREAFRAAADPARYPEQIQEGLRPWQARKLYFAGGGPGGRGAGPAAGAPAGVRGAAGVDASPAAPAHVTRIDTGVYDPLLGRTYAEIGNDARSNHKCQGVGGVPPLPGGAGGRGGRGGGGTYTLVDTTIPGQKDKDEASFFDGVDVSLAGLSAYAGATPPPALVEGLRAIATSADRAKQAFDSGEDAATAAPVEAGLAAVRALRASLGSMGLGETARYEIDFRLKLKEQDYQDAVLAAHDVTFQAVADDGLVIDGQPVRLSLIGVNHGSSDVTVSEVAIEGFENPGACAAAAVKKDGVFACAVAVTVPKNAKVTDPYFTDTYWKNPSGPAINAFDPSVPFGVPFAPTPFHVVFHVKAGSVDVTKDVPVEYRYVKDLYFGDKRMKLNVVPAFSVVVTPTLAIFPAETASTTTAATPATREIFVSVTNSTKGAAEATVALELPAGWRATPARTTVSFDKEDESRSVRFVVVAPARAAIGDYTARAVVTSPSTGAERFMTGYQAIEYPHIERQQVIKPAETAMKVIDVNVARGLAVGYIMGVGDQVPPAIQQLGAKVTFLEASDLAWGDLSAYDVIVTGVRAYERRDDLRAYNSRLLDYATAGGTVIVQYNKTEFNQAQYGPYPASVGQGRVADETVPVKILVPADPLFNFPNKIGPSAWDNWTQERGLYFLGQKDPRYVDLVSMVDSFPDNPGEKLGSFVEARVGKGHWIYLGLGLWRQLPAGTVGAYQLLANLISLPKAPAR